MCFLVRYLAQHMINSLPKHNEIASQFYTEAFLDSHFIFFSYGLVNLQEKSDGNKHSHAAKSE